MFTVLCFMVALTSDPPVICHHRHWSPLFSNTDHQTECINTMFFIMQLMMGEKM